MTDYDKEDMEIVHDAGGGVSLRVMHKYKYFVWDRENVILGPVALDSSESKSKLQGFADGYARAKSSCISKIAEKLLELSDDDMTPAEIMEEYYGE